jgi:mono/diheme cytochrome c family protein
MWREGPWIRRAGFWGAQLFGAVLVASAFFVASATGVLRLTAPMSVLAQKPASAELTADLPAGAMRAKATSACLACHEARIILQQRLSKAAWTREVDKMTKWGAVVDPADRQALIDYLSTNFSPDKPPYEPQRTSPGKSESNAK